MKNNQIISYITPDVTEDEMREIIAFMDNKNKRKIAINKERRLYY